tara:strand:+ start:128 stop:268 length:141 start_codon:yes stop_codon:yes gene_type:complete
MKVVWVDGVATSTVAPELEELRSRKWRCGKAKTTIAEARIKKVLVQ